MVSKMDYNIINKNSIKIIELLNEGRAYFSEIHKKTGIASKNNLLKNLSLLTANKIIVKEEKTANTYYSLNYSSSFLIGILNLINQTRFEKLPFNVKKSISECIIELKPRMAVLFGSYAKENYKKESDIDLLILGSSGGQETRIKEISKKYGVQINAVFMELKKIDLSSESLKHIFRTGYPLTGEIYFYNEFKEI